VLRDSDVTDRSAWIDEWPRCVLDEVGSRLDGICPVVCTRNETFPQRPAEEPGQGLQTLPKNQKRIRRLAHSNLRPTR
jgi:hypothetical protein